MECWRSKRIGVTIGQEMLTIIIDRLPFSRPWRDTLGSTWRFRLYFTFSTGVGAKSVDVSRSTCHASSCTDQTLSNWWLIDGWVILSLDKLVRIFIYLIRKTKIVCGIINTRFFHFHFVFPSTQYVFLQCPIISGFQWHPFSLSSVFFIKDISYLIINSKQNIFRILVLRFNSPRMDSSHEN